MKVAVIGTRGLPPRYGGFETLADRLSRGLAEREHDVTVYGRTGYGQPRSARPSAQVLALRMPTVPLPSVETIIASGVSVLHAVIRSRPDVALVCNPVNVWVSHLLLAAGIPVVLHLDGLEHLRPKWRGVGARLHKASMSHAARMSSRLTLLTDSAAIADWYWTRLGVRTNVIEYGADRPLRSDEQLRAFGLVSGGFDLIVARWEPDNQVAEMVAAHAASGDSTTLVVVGQPRTTRYSKRVSSALAAHPHAIATGPVWSQSALAALFGGARLYLHGHTVGGTNPTLLLGCSSGATVLAHSNPFNREVVQDFAWLWNNPDELTVYLKTRPWESTSPSRDLAALTLARYEWPDIIHRYEKLLLQAAQR